MGVPPPSSSTNIFNSRRPVLLSADSRRISYTSKSGRTLTLEMRSSRAGVPTLASLKAAAAAVSLQQQQQQPTKESSSGVQSQALHTQQQKQLSAAADAKSGPATQAAALVAQAASDGNAVGMWPDFFDTLSFWCMEAVEIACFGPYEEPQQLYDALDAYVDSVAATPAVEYPPALSAPSFASKSLTPPSAQPSVHAGLLPPTTAVETAAR